MYHEHPLRILRYSVKNIWLLIFPLLRGVSVLHFKAEDWYIWLKGAWFDILILCLIILFGFIRWNFSTISIDEGELVYRAGIILRIYTSIPVSSISVVTAERKFYLVPFSGVNLSFDTRAGIFKTTDMTILVTEKISDEIMKSIPCAKMKKSTEEVHKAGAFSVLLFSVFFSSGFSGVVYIAAFFFKGGDIAHDIISVSLSRITETTEKFTEKIEFIQKIPTAAVAVGIVFLSAWLLSFIVNILRYSRFHIDSDGEYFHVVCGILNRRNYNIKSEHINYSDLRQNLIMKIFGAVTVNISCAGYGAGSQYLPVLLPIKLEKNLGKSLEQLGIFGGVKNEFRPKLSSVWNYTWQPVIFGLSLIPAYRISVHFLPALKNLIFFLVIMLAIPSVWLTVIRITALCTSGISIYDDKIILRCSKWTSFHTVVAERKNIVKFEIKQTVFQKYTNKNCRVSVWLCGETKARYTVRALKMSDVQNIAKLTDF